MNNPPIPFKPGDWATLLALLTWVFSKNDPAGAQLGHFRDGRGTITYIAAADRAAGGVKWALSTTAPSNGVAESLASTTTANILKNGTTLADGRVSYGGVTYTIALFWDGANPTIKAV